MNLNTWYEKGLTPKEYMEDLDKHKEGFMNIHKNFRLPEDEEFFKELKDRNLRAVVLAEVWCGHCMLDIPILLHLAEAANVPVRFLRRDENLELMDQYLTNGKSRTIPIMIFIDEDGTQVAQWGPVAPEVKAFVQKYRTELPDKDDPAYDEKFKAMIKITSKEFAENESIWTIVYNDIKKALQ